MIKSLRHNFPFIKIKMRATQTAVNLTIRVNFGANVEKIRYRWVFENPPTLDHIRFKLRCVSRAAVDKYRCRISFVGVRFLRTMTGNIRP